MTTEYIYRQAEAGVYAVNTDYIYEQAEAGLPHKVEWWGDEDPGQNPENDGEDDLREGAAGLCRGETDEQENHQLFKNIYITLLFAEAIFNCWF